MALGPRPISTIGYHDWHLTGLLLPRRSRQASLLVEHEDGRQATIRMKGVAHLSVRDILAHNIIFSVDCYRIDGPELVEAVAQAFLGHRNQYYTERTTGHPSFGAQTTGKLFVVVNSSYGADLLAVAESVTEDPDPRAS